MNGRQKCADSILDILKGYSLEREVSMVDFITKDWKNLEVDVNIDIKAQLSSIREILILSMSTRIMINCAEFLPRMINKKLYNEMLTHGSEKMDRISDQISAMFNNKYFAVSFNNSEDMNTWCQGFWVMQFLSM